MEISRDFEELFKTLNTFRIRYLVVGSYALAYHERPRYTKDIDVLIPPGLNRPAAVFKALAKFGVPLKGLSVADFSDKSMVLQIGVAPVRIDIMLNLPGVPETSAWKSRKRSRYGKTPINILGLDALIAAKRKAGRPQDRVDLERLLQLRKKRRR